MYSIQSTLVAVAATFIASSAFAGGLNLNIDLGVLLQPKPEVVYVAPPPAPAPAVVYVQPAPQLQIVLPAEPPQFLFVQELGYYVAVGVACDLIFHDHAYYIHENGNWFRTEYYGGQWSYADAKLIPLRITSYNISEIRRFRDHEFHLFERDRAHYRGQLHRPEIRLEIIREREHREAMRLEELKREEHRRAELRREAVRLEELKREEHRREELRREELKREEMRRAEAIKHEIRHEEAVKHEIRREEAVKHEIKREVKREEVRATVKDGDRKKNDEHVDHEHQNNH